MGSLFSTQQPVVNYTAEHHRRQAELERVTWQQLIPPSQCTSCVYIIGLIEQKHYVGWTDNLEARLQEHRNGQGSVWTQRYPMLQPEQVRVIYTTDRFDEDKYTKMMMAKHGIANVRGGSYVTMTLSPETVAFLQREIVMTTDCCIRCGKKGHYANKCLYDIGGVRNGNVVNISSNMVRPTRAVNVPPAYNQRQSNPSDQLTNAGSKWTTNEEKLLTDRFSRGMTTSEIAKLHGRTEYAIKCRLEKLGYLSM